MAKEVNFETVAEKTLRIAWLRGLESVNHSEVSRAAGVSRAWLYKYVGRSSEDVIKFAADYWGKVFSRLDTPPCLGTREEWLEQTVSSFEFLLDFAQAKPWALDIFFRYRGTATPIGEQIETVEAKYLDKTQREIQHCLKIPLDRARLDARILVGARLGIITYLQKSPRKESNDRKRILWLMKATLEALAKK
jgi:hypothetical protein